MPLKTLADALKIKNVTAPLNGGEKLFKMWKASGNKSYQTQYQQWKGKYPKINWKEKGKEWSK